MDRVRRVRGVVFQSALKRLMLGCLVAVLMASGSAAESRLFSSGGGMGSYYHSFLTSSEAAGLNENRFATVRTITNSGETSEGEWVVNCNEQYPQVVTPDDRNIELSLAEDPPSATQMPHELWWAVCRREFSKFSYDISESPARIEQGKTGSITLADGRKVGYEALSTEDANLLGSLTKIRLDAGRAGRKQDIAFVYCSSSVPTVSWTDEHVELSVADQAGHYDASTVMISDAVYALACGTDDPAVGEATFAAPETPPEALITKDSSQDADAVSQPVAQASIPKAGLTFRGISLNQSLEQIRQDLPSGFELVQITDFYQISSKSEWFCGAIYLEGNAVREFTLAPCYFELDEMIAADVFAKLITEHYGVAMIPGVSKELNSNLKFEDTFVYRGEADTGETLIVKPSLSGVQAILSVFKEKKGVF